LFLAGTVLALVVVPAGAMAMPVATTAISQMRPPSADVIEVRDHGHSHRHGHHRRDHRFHGRDDYYDSDDQSGVLFKSFITGTLFR
jgi:hypothetical protein